MAKRCCCMVSLRFVSSSVFVSWVSVAPSAGMFCSVSASRIGSPMPVWSMRSFWRWNWVLMWAVVAMTSVYAVSRGNSWV